MIAIKECFGEVIARKATKLSSKAIGKRLYFRNNLIFSLN